MFRCSRSDYSNSHLLSRGKSLTLVVWRRKSYCLIRQEWTPLIDTITTQWFDCKSSTPIKQIMVEPETSTSFLASISWICSHRSIEWGWVAFQRSWAWNVSFKRNPATSWTSFHDNFVKIFTTDHLGKAGWIKNNMGREINAILLTVAKELSSKDDSIKFTMPYIDHSLGNLDR